MARHPRSRALWGDASPLIKRRVQAAVPQLHLVSKGFTRDLESSARIPRFHTSVEAVTPPGDAAASRDPRLPVVNPAIHGRTCHFKSGDVTTIVTVYAWEDSLASGMSRNSLQFPRLDRVVWGSHSPRTAGHLCGI